MEKALKKFEEYAEKLRKNEITIQQFTRITKRINAIIKKELNY